MLICMFSCTALVLKHFIPAQNLESALMIAAAHGNDDAVEELLADSVELDVNLVNKVW